MNATRKIIYLALLAVWCAVPTVSFADKCAGTNINNLISWEPTEIVKGTTLATMRITSVIVSDDPGAPYHRPSANALAHSSRRPMERQGPAEVARVRTKTATF